MPDPDLPSYFGATTIDLPRRGGIPCSRWLFQFHFGHDRCLCRCPARVPALARARSASGESRGAASRRRASWLTARVCDVKMETHTTPCIAIRNSISARHSRQISAFPLDIDRTERSRVTRCSLINDHVQEVSDIHSCTTRETTSIVMMKSLAAVGRRQRPDRLAADSAHSRSCPDASAAPRVPGARSPRPFLGCRGSNSSPSAQRAG